ncbi:MAG: BNR repeat-containing protein, partial [Draconibacterium sp.]|nr:BNR repeat-containing protein [Draconibacterium sp.]
KWINNDFKYQWEQEMRGKEVQNKKTKIQILDCIEVDSVPADFPVGFSSLTKGEWQFIAYYNKNRNLTVASRKLSQKKWNYKILPTKVGWDSHNRITMAFDRDFCIHVSGNMHNDSMTYFKTERPLDISTFEKIFPLVSAENEMRCTYPSFLKTPDGKVVFSYRLGGSGNGITITSLYNERTKTFKRLSNQPLFDGLNQMSAYASGPRLGPDGWYHLAWLWRDTPHCETNHDPSYARSKDLITWETIDGIKLELPITPNSKQFIVDPVPAGGGVINGAYRYFFDEKNNPLLVYMKYDKFGNNQLYVAKSENQKWKIKQVSNWDYRWEFKGPGSITFEIRIRNAHVKDNKITIEYLHKNEGDGELVVDLKTLLLLEDNKVEVVEKAEYPKELMDAKRSDEGMSVHWMKLKSPNQNSSEYYGLRWETMGKRRFYKAPETPVKPSVLKLYKLKTND